MKSGWKKISVQQLIDTGEAQVKTGPFGTQLHASDYVEDGTPVINVRNVGFGDLREEKLEFISDETVQRLSSHLLQPNDIVFGRKGAVERHAFIRDRHARWFQGSDCIRLRIMSDSVDPRYVSYALLTDRHKHWMMNQCSHGATMASLNQEIISRIPLQLPPIDIQRQIVTILSAYDDLIENNMRRIAILEEMAQALYREWFVHFRFPGHEGVRMVESEVGEIPEGWELAALKAASGFISRGVSPRYDDESADLVINQRCIRDGKVSLDLARRHSTRVPTDKRVRCGDVLINSTGVGTLGRVAQVSANLKDCTVDSHVSIVRPADRITRDYFGLSLLSLEPHFAGLGTGSTGQTELSRTSIGETKILVPNFNVQSKFAEIVSPLRSMVTLLLEKNTNLRHTRNLLLPKLVSGEIDVTSKDISKDKGEQ